MKRQQGRTENRPRPRLTLFSPKLKKNAQMRRRLDEGPAGLYTSLRVSGQTAKNNFGGNKKVPDKFAPFRCSGSFISRVFPASGYFGGAELFPARKTV